MEQDLDYGAESESRAWSTLDFESYVTLMFGLGAETSARACRSRRSAAWLARPGLAGKVDGPHSIFLKKV